MHEAMLETARILRQMKSAYPDKSSPDRMKRPANREYLVHCYELFSVDDDGDMVDSADSLMKAKKIAREYVREVYGHIRIQFAGLSWVWETPVYDYEGGYRTLIEGGWISEYREEIPVYEIKGEV